MPNPNRPQYQDTIEETWGDAVADTVVRRYANTADRDADLAGFTPAELAGQTIVIIPPGGPPMLQSHDGAAWSNLARSSAGETSATTDQYGNFAVTVGPPGTKLIGATAIGALSQYPMIIVRNADNMAAGGPDALFRVFHLDGTGWGNAAVMLSWVAVWSN
jgi:hypothetical protein